MEHNSFFNYLWCANNIVNADADFFNTLIWLQKSTMTEAFVHKDIMRKGRIKQVFDEIDYNPSLV